MNYLYLYLIQYDWKLRNFTIKIALVAVKIN